jgi:GNAT superfamily N-acetyltransferase
MRAPADAICRHAPGCQTGGVQVREIDPNDDEQLRSWWAVQHASRTADWPQDTPLTFTAARAIANGGFGAKRFVLAVADDEDGRAVGCSMLGLPQRDNTGTIEADLQVDPDRRRRGVGRALALHAERLARREGRTTIAGGYEEPLDDPRAGGAFAAALGYEPVLSELRRELHLPIGHTALDELEASCAPYAEGYRLVRWQDRNPDELVEGRLELERTMSRDAPHGDLEHEPQEWDEERLRGGEATVAAMGVTTFFAGATRSVTGDLVAFTAIGVHHDSPENGDQWATIVLGQERGHRLGMLVKIANIRQVMERSPLTRRIQTWNGETNRHMTRVNDELGFVVTARAVLVQKRLGVAAEQAAAAAP